MNLLSTNLTPVVHVDYAPGNLGNKVLQYLAAWKLAQHIPGAELSNVRIAEFGIDVPEVDLRGKKTLRYRSYVTSRIDFEDIRKRVNKDHVDRIELKVYSSHLDNLPDVASSRNLLPLDPDVSGYGLDILVINIRGAEILIAIHPDYTVIPVSFYKQIIAQTGLKPVFIGQLDGESCYLDQLRSAFPDEDFVSSRGALHDFSVIAKSKNIVIAVSTFSWLAGWLSNADLVIMPMSGFYNPIQYPSVNLVPVDDARFRFYIFPINHAVTDDKIVEAHAALDGTWRPINPDELRRILAQNILPAVSPEVPQGRVRRLVGKVTRYVRGTLAD